MKNVIAAAVLCGILFATLAAGSFSDNFPDGLAIGMFTVVLLAAGAAYAAYKGQKAVRMALKTAADK